MYIHYKTVLLCVHSDDVEDAWLVFRFLWWNNHPGAVGGARKKNIFNKYNFVVFVESKETGMVLVAEG